jgi:ADP-ribosyl-[dinitrogen reductase] hydrolase
MYVQRVTIRQTFNDVDVTLDKIQGALMGTAVGDALGMPIEGLSHQNIRTYYKGIKEYRDDEKRGDLKAGQWTDDTQLTFAVARALRHAPSIAALTPVLRQEYIALREHARRWGPTTTAAVDRLAGITLQPSMDVPQPTNGAAMRAAPLGVWWALSGADVNEAVAALRPVFELTHRHPASLAAGIAQAFAVRYALLHTPGTFQRDAFWSSLVETVQAAERQLGDHDSAVSHRLILLGDHLDDFPLDLQDLCNGTGVAADESWPFAVAMFARNPGLVEGTLLAAINVGGDADTTGAMAGALLGAFNGWSAFPESWKKGLEDGNRLEAEARAFAEFAVEHYGS